MCAAPSGGLNCVTVSSEGDRKVGRREEEVEENVSPPAHSVITRLGRRKRTTLIPHIPVRRTTHHTKDSIGKRFVVYIKARVCSHGKKECVFCGRQSVVASRSVSRGRKILTGRDGERSAGNREVV